jgi:hypothetical protein
MLVVIGTVRRHGRDHALGLPKQGRHLGDIVGKTLGQHVCCDLAAAGVHGQMQLAPLPARPAMFLSVPFALAEQFQACAVQRKVDRANTGQRAAA